MSDMMKDGFEQVGSIYVQKVQNLSLARGVHLQTDDVLIKHYQISTRTRVKENYEFNVTFGMRVPPEARLLPEVTQLRERGIGYFFGNGLNDTYVWLSRGAKDNIYQLLNDIVGAAPRQEIDPLQALFPQAVNALRNGNSVSQCDRRSPQQHCAPQIPRCG